MNMLLRAHLNLAQTSGGKKERLPVNTDKGDPEEEQLNYNL